jgi:ComF family protein
MILTKCTLLFYDALLTVIYPQPCAICARSVETTAAGVACEHCWRVTRLFNGNETMCWKCGAPSQGIVLETKRTEVRCHRCESFEFAVARSCGVYDRALRETVLSLKRQPKLAGKVLDLLTGIASQDPLAESTSIVPVPLHFERLRARGFNQASVIARSLSTRLRLPVNEVSLVRRQQAEKYRSGLDAKGRSETVAGAFEVVHPSLVQGEKILLVDDVFTTGATADACSKALLAAGVEKVYVLTIARTAR